MSHESSQKLLGLHTLRGSGLTVPSMLMIETAQDLHRISSFIREHSYVPLWFVRSMIDSPRRYRIGNRIFTPDEMLKLIRNWPWDEGAFPFVIQQFIEAHSSGILLIRGEKACVEFACGSFGPFLRGVDAPGRALFRIDRCDKPVVIDQVPYFSSHLPELLRSANIALLLALEHLDENSFITEWVEDKNGKFFFVDWETVPNCFIPEPLENASGSRIIFPGEFLGPVWLCRTGIAPPLNHVIVMTWPLLPFVHWLEEKKVRGVIIKKGAWLSHLAVRAAKLGIGVYIGSPDSLINVHEKGSN